MREYILCDDENVYKIGCSGKKQLTLSRAQGENVSENTVLTPHECQLFSGDIDKNGVIHIAAVTCSTLTYIKYYNGSLSTTHLMRLPEKFKITSVLINAEEELRLNYCVKSREGCAIIEYTARGDNWQGKNIFTDPCDMQILAVGKYKNECYTEKSKNGVFTLINAYEPDKTIYSSPNPVLYLQRLNGGVIFNAGENIVYNGDEVLCGQRVFAVDGKRVIISDGDTLKEYIAESGLRFSGQVHPPRGATEYVLKMAGNNKRIMLSSPFPYIKYELQYFDGGGLSREVYMQQRTLFQLQAEVRSLKSRLKRVEDDQKRLLSMQKQQ